MKAIVSIAPVLAYVLCAAPVCGAPDGPDGTNSGTGRSELDSSASQPMVRIPLPPEQAARMRLRDQARQEAEGRLAHGDLLGARALFLRAIELSPQRDGVAVGMSTTYRDLGRLCLKLGRNAEALAHLQNAYRTNLARTPLLCDLALACCRLGDRAGALHYYSDEVVLDRLTGYHLSNRDLPGTATLRQLEASTLLGRSILTAGQRSDEERIDDLLAADRLAPNNAVVAWKCGWELARAGRHDEALDRARRAARYGHGYLADQARRLADNIVAWQRERQEHNEGAGPDLAR